MQFYPFSVAVGSAFTLFARGNFLRYYDVTTGAASPTLRVRPHGSGGAGGGDFLLRPGQSVKLPASAPGFSIENFDAALTIVGRVLVGEGDFNDSVITGAVTITGIGAVAQGDATARTEGTAVIGVASTAVVAAQPARRVLRVMSRPTNTADIYVNFGAAATLVSAIRLAPGESWEEVLAGALACNAISSVAAQNLDWYSAI